MTILSIPGHFAKAHGPIAVTDFPLMRLGICISFSSNPINLLIVILPFSMDVSKSEVEPSTITFSTIGACTIGEGIVGAATDVVLLVGLENACDQMCTASAEY